MKRQHADGKTALIPVPADKKAPVFFTKDLFTVSGCISGIHIFFVF